MEYEVGEHITLKLVGEKTKIYVDGKLFKQCKFLLLNFSNISNEYCDKGSIEEVVDSSESFVVKGYNITPEEEFRAHCSSTQSWVEHDYDTRLLHVNLAFPLLKRLVEVGDIKAKRVFKDEIAKRFSYGYPTIIKYLKEEKYLDYFTFEELITLLTTTDCVKYNIDLSNYFDSGYIIPLIELMESDSEALLNIKKIDTYRSKFDLPKSISKSILKLKNLRELTMRGIDTIPKFIGRLKLLQTLDLSKSNLTQLPKSIGDLQSLQTLELSNNNLTRLPESIGNILSLQRLSLHHNKLIEIPRSIGNLILLKNLGLSYNNLKQIPESIEKLQSLFSLYLSYNNLTQIPEFVGQLQSLQLLYLSGNKFIKLPESIEGLHSLRKLIVSDNQLKTIPQFIGKLKSLQELDLSDNKISEVPEFLQNLRSLKKLYLRNNRILEIPEWIIDLHGRKDVYVDLFYDEDRSKTVSYYDWNSI